VEACTVLTWSGKNFGVQKKTFKKTNTLLAIIAAVPVVQAMPACNFLIYMVM